jgi:hypothetical protein
MARRVLGPRAALLDALKLWEGGELNMTFLALRCSRFINGVALRHQEVSREMFPDFPIGAVTNGVHAVQWTSEPFKRLFDRHMPGVAPRQHVPALRLHPAGGCGARRARRGQGRDDGRGRAAHRASVSTRRR